MAEIIQQQDQRRAFVDTLIELASNDETVVLITCDVGFNYLETFCQKFPSRFLNLGVTEASATMIAVGMAKAGLKPYVYSMIPFVLFRGGEMVRNGLVGHNVAVTLLGVKGSSSYKMLGFSHNLLHEKEDFNFCDNIGLTHYNPRSNEEVKDVINLTYKEGKPCYIRLT